MTWESVKDREHFLNEAPGLVTPLEFLMPLYKGIGSAKLAMKTGLVLYDLMAGKKRHGFLSPEQFGSTVPYIKQDGLLRIWRHNTDFLSTCRVLFLSTLLWVRISRIVVPGYHHRVTDRGVWLMDVFHSEVDRRGFPRTYHRLYDGRFGTFSSSLAQSSSTSLQCVAILLRA